MGIKFKNVSYSYGLHTPFERSVLHKIDIEIQLNHYTAIIGHTGSGKSTLLQHLNGILRPTEGQVQYDNIIIGQEKRLKGLKELRSKVGIVFQFPEQQLFEETVEKDIIFGPINYGVSQEEARKRAVEALLMVGLDQSYLSRSPFDLSGGEMRRVAIAGILAMKPDILVLDEPTAGLDPVGKNQILEMVNELHKSQKATIILVTHHMDDALKYAKELFVINNGRIVASGTPYEVFRMGKIEQYGLTLPNTIKLQQAIENKFGIQLPNVLRTPEEVVDAYFHKVCSHKSLVQGE